MTLSLALTTPVLALARPASHGTRDGKAA